MLLGSLIISVCAGLALGAAAWMVGGPLLGLLAYAVGGAAALLLTSVLRHALGRARPKDDAAIEPGANSASAASRSGT